MAAEHDPKIEEIPSDDEAPGLEPAENTELASGGKAQNRNEKKVRKHLAKTGLVSVPGVTKVSVRKGGQVRFQTLSLELAKRSKSIEEPQNGRFQRNGAFIESNSKL